MGVEIARVYDVIGSDHTGKFLVDRLWPRGLSKAKAPFEEWLRDIAPTPELRKWYSHDLAKYDEFVRKYRHELKTGTPAELVAKLRERSAEGDIVLLTASKDLEHSDAAVLSDLLTTG